MNKKNNRKEFKRVWRLKRTIKIHKRLSKNKLNSNSKKKMKKDIEVSQATVLPYLIKNEFRKKKRCKNKVSLNVPKDFSLHTNADEVLVFLKELVYYCTKPTIKDIFIDHTNTNRLSLSASVLMDIILMSRPQYMKTRSKTKEFRLHGEVPSDTDIGVLLHANGVLPHLGFDIEKLENVETLKLLYGTNTTANVEEPASEIIKYFSACLVRQGLKLLPKGKRQLGKLVGEVMDNCKIHAGKNSRWYALGFYHDKGHKGKFHLVILNIGNSIYESLNKVSNTEVSEETYSLLKKKTEQHQKHFNGKWNEEALWTLLSLQDGVSRLRDSKDINHSNRGKGTVDMLSSFQAIASSIDGDECNFSIISGNTQIIFDFNKYPLFITEVQGEERKLITFNTEGSIDTPPNFENIKLLRNKFPGTIISMEFYINPAYIDNKQQIVRRN